MTEDPTRLIDPGAGAAPLERELLASLRSGAPPEGSQTRVWLDLNRQIAAAGVLGAAVIAPKAAAASATAANTGIFATKAVVAKWLLGLSLGATGLGAVVLATRSGSPPPAATVAVVAPKPAAAPVAAPAVTAEPAPAVDAEPPRESAARAPAMPSKADALDRESRLLVAARAALRAGDVARAAATLSELEARFPRGMLGQEREVLKIELMAARGDRAGAARRAERFVAAHPNSPHAKNLSRFTHP